MDGIIAMLPAPFQKFSTHMDFPGQRSAERTYQVIMVLSGIIGFFVGYSSQQLSHAIYTVLIGALVSALVTLPPWPVFRQNPIAWLSVEKEQQDTKSEAVESKKKK